ncbi:MAG: nucleotidyltransferase [Fusobacteriia bacterium 4572_132]|nr:MAG: nucleotidyltransferase [Fusobacteriia bacterium 4572_132]
MYGLTKDEFYKIMNILNKYQKSINWVKIFGSRAVGNYKRNSDIDLSIDFKKDIILELKNEFYKTDISYTVDIIDYRKNMNQRLKKDIDEEGKIILKIEGDKIQMNINKLNNKLDDFKKALAKLNDSLKKDPKKDDLYLDGTIQRFEFVFELSWKLMKNYLEYIGIEVNSPRMTFREAFKSNIIEDASKWIKMMEDRNRTSYTYNEDTAWEIYRNIKEKYITLFCKFEEQIDVKITKLS